MQKFECKNIKKHFGGVKAVQGASLKLEEGEIRALFGGNGSGKSTLSKIIGGVVAPDEGQILIDGKEVRINSPSDAKDHGIVITSQELSLFYNSDIERNIVFNSLPLKFNLLVEEKIIEEKIRDYIDKLNLNDVKHLPVSLLPDNKRYLVEFGKALIQEPKLLIIDEITSALFSQDFEIVKEIIFDLSSKGVTIIYISHRMNEIYDVCDNVTVMRNGQTIETVKLEDISHDELLKLMTGGHSGADEAAQAETLKTKEKSIAVQGKVNEKLVIKNLYLEDFKNRVDLEVNTGEFIGISGLQGQGQSSFLRTLYGTKQKVTLDLFGKSTTISSPIDAIKNGIGFLSGNREIEGTFSERTVRENIDVVHNYVLSRGDVNYKQTIKDYNIVVDNIRQPIKSLSGGNQQKVVISRWTNTEPKILLADDPNKGVDVQARIDVHLIIKSLIENGAIVLMASSDDEELVDIAKVIPNTRILIFYNGNIVKTLTDEEITVPNIISSSLGKGVVTK